MSSQEPPTGGIPLSQFFDEVDPQFVKQIENVVKQQIVNKLILLIKVEIEPQIVYELEQQIKKQEREGKTPKIAPRGIEELVWQKLNQAVQPILKELEQQVVYKLMQQIEKETEQHIKTKGVNIHKIPKDVEQRIIESLVQQDVKELVPPILKEEAQQIVKEIEQQIEKELQNETEENHEGGLGRKRILRELY